MTLLMSATMGCFCAMPILSTNYVNPIESAITTFISGFLFSLPMSVGIMVSAYYIINSFYIRWMFLIWLSNLLIINYTDLNYWTDGDRLIANVIKAATFTIPIYLAFVMFTWSHI